MDERLRFVARLLEGEKMAPLCAEFGFPARRATRSTTGTKIAGRGIQRPQQAAASPSGSAACAHRGHDRPPEAGVSGLGCAEDPGETAAAGHWTAPACDGPHQHPQDPSHVADKVVLHRADVRCDARVFEHPDAPAWKWRESCERDRNHARDVGPRVVDGDARLQPRDC
jgi:hypothetical protein